MSLDRPRASDLLASQQPSGAVVRRAIAISAGLAVAWVAYVTFGALALGILLPGMAGYGAGVTQSWVLTLVAVPIVASLLLALGWWQRAGFVGVARWRSLRLYLLPVPLLFLPLVEGVKPLSVDTLLLLVAGYAATAFVEEGSSAAQYSA